MKYLFFLITMIFTVQAFAQDSGNFFNMLLGISGSYNREYRTLNGNSDNILYKQRNDRELPINAFDLGVNLGYNINPTFGVETGLHYSQRGFDSKDIPLDFGNNNPNEPQYYRSLKELSYLSVPLRANIWFGKGKLRLITGLGANLDFLINGKVTTTYTFVNNAVTEEDESSGYDFRKIGFSPTASIGMDLFLKKNNYLRLEPFIRYDVFSILKKSPIKENLWGYGLRLAYMYGI